jgi:hypothetical protein
MGQGDVDEFLEVLDRRLAVKYDITHATPGSTAAEVGCKARSDEFGRFLAAIIQ